jgi:hypothetical protein
MSYSEEDEEDVQMEEDEFVVDEDLMEDYNANREHIEDYKEGFLIYIYIFF